VKNGKGSLGAIITDTTLVISLTEAFAKIKAVGENANFLNLKLNNIAQNVKLDLTTSKGAFNGILKDTLLTVKLNSSLFNIEAGTVSFNENMEALKHNFLLRGYFKKQEKKKKKEQEVKRKITAGEM
jgi:phospholipid/cholesterol/gamma-HCH transport system substrate-binding protein